MKSAFLLFLLCLLTFLCTSARAQCPLNLRINTDQDVADFRFNYPNCTQLITGNLTIEGQSITDLEGLEVLTYVGGDVLLNNLSVRNIIGLENITTVGGNFTLANCPRLVNNGFPEGLSVNRIGGFLSLDNLPGLTSFIPLNDLNILSSGFGSNALKISNLAPLSGLTGNMASVNLTNNPDLTDLTALNNIGTISSLTITGNSSLNNCAIDPICAALGAGNPATISGNSGACASLERVEEVCFPPCTTPDYNALEAIYNATNGDNWTDNTNWLTDCDYCTWFGVTCDVNGRVRRLELPNNNLIGTLPAELADLTEVEYLRFNNNSFTGGVPNLIALDKLQRLRLHRAGFTGALPILGNKPDLTHLSLYDNAFSGSIPGAYNEQAFPAMEFFYLDRNQLSGTLRTSLAEFPNLQEINLHTNNFTGCYPVSFTALCGLSSALFYNNPNLPDGGSTEFFENNFCVDGEQCGPCHPDLPGLLAFYEGLNQLNNNPTFTGWAEGAAGTDCQPCNWYGVTCDANDRVTELTFVSVGLTGSLVPEISLLTALEALNLPSNNISGNFPDVLWNMPNLRVIGLPGNNLGGPLPDAGNLQTMERIFLQQNNFFGALPIFGNCPNMEAINLSDNPFGDVIEDRGYNPTNMPLLTTLLLSNTSLVGFLPAELGEWPDGQLATFSVANNDLQGDYPASYASFCGTDPDFSANAQLPDGGSATTFTSLVCGPCHPDFPGLMALYNGLNQFEGNTSLSNWAEGAAGTDCAPCDWTGITCDANDRVTAIQLVGRSLTGNLVPEINLLTELKTFNLTNNGITGALPAAFWTMPNLEVIALERNDLSGMVPDPGSLPNIVSIFLRGNNFTGGLPTFGSCPNLSTLTLDGNPLGGSIAGRGYNATNLPSVVNLDLGNAGLIGELPEELGSWPDGQFFSFRLDNNDLEGCYPASFSILCGTNPDFTGNAQLPDGGSSDFFNNIFCATGEGCEPVCSPDFDALIALYNATDGPNWTDNSGWADGAADTDCNVCDWVGVTCLGDRVQRLELRENALAGPIPAEISELGRLEVLSLGRNGLTGGLPASLFTLRFLETIELEFNELMGTVPDFSESASLRRLALQYNDFIGPLPALGQPSGVVELIVSNNDLTGAIPNSWNGGNLAQLELLSLNSNQLTGELPAGVADITTLQIYSVAFNNLSGCYPVGYSVFCSGGITVDFINNTGLPEFGSSIFFTNEFCANNDACGALPVTWLSFSATAQEKTVRLDWKTASEQDNDFFVVERSKDGGNWTSLGEVPAVTAIVAGVRTYQFTDIAPFAGASFYRLRQVDLDGIYGFSAVRSVSFMGQNSQVYPNPVGDEFTIYAAKAQAINLYASDGRLVRTVQHLGGGAQVQREGLKSGVYWLRFSASGEAVKVVMR